jgi:hypothetical protein
VLAGASPAPLRRRRSATPLGRGVNMPDNAIICVTSDIPDAARQRLHSDISAVFPAETRPSPSFRTVPSAQPSFVQVLANAALWTLLLVPATRFLAQIGKRAADDVWDHKKEMSEALKEAAVLPLKRLAGAINACRAASIRKPDVVVGIPLPEDYFGTAIRFKPQSPEEIAWAVANLVVKAPDVERVIRAEMLGKRPPLGPVQIELQPDGSLIIKWMDRIEMKIHETRVE